MAIPTENSAHAYANAQHAIATLKSSIYRILLDAGNAGLRNVDVGRSLGINAGHIKHQSHIQRTLLAMMEKEGVVEQDPGTKYWRLCSRGQYANNNDG
ncbi:MAG: hypothetical protein OXQ89_07195 [Rhodospirillaceae bacterium]|nr:hypothetical protein [Rhodospirillaceae bacterium]